MRHVVCVPTLAQHVYADHATDTLTRLTWSADRGNNFAQLLRCFLASCPRVFAFRRLQQIRINSQRNLSALAIPKFVKSSKAASVSLLRFCFLPALWRIVIFVLIVRRVCLDDFFAGNPSMEMLRDVCVVANDYDHGWCSVLARGRSQQLVETLFPFTGQCQESILSFSVNHFRFRFATVQSFSRLQIAGDVVPQFEVLRIGTTGIVDSWQ